MKLKSISGQKYLNKTKIQIQNLLDQINTLEFESVFAKKDFIKLQLDTYKEENNQDELILNDIFVIESYLMFFLSYCELWKKIYDEEYSGSWDKIQDSLDLLRCIKKFSDIKMDFFECQLQELEKAYPYKTFFSIGAIVDHFECSICKNDSDSDECVHLAGELYNGRLAQRIAKKVTKLDHIGLVDNPADKRCKVVIDDSDSSFNIIRYISTLLRNDTLSIFQFKELKFSTINISNTNSLKQGRNERCRCGSGEKFKKCCISKKYIGQEHCDIIPNIQTLTSSILLN